jgi:hypothetical protein
VSTAAAKIVKSGKEVRKEKNKKRGRGEERK